MKLVPCKHWYDCGLVDGGGCRIQIYHQPSVGICMTRCADYDGPDRGLGDTVKRVIHRVMPQKKNCGACRRRQRQLNQFISYHGDSHHGNDLLGR